MDFVKQFQHLIPADQAIPSRDLCLAQLKNMTEYSNVPITPDTLACRIEYTQLWCALGHSMQEYERNRLKLYFTKGIYLPRLHTPDPLVFDNGEVKSSSYVIEIVSLAISTAASLIDHVFKKCIYHVVRSSPVPLSTNTLRALIESKDSSSTGGVVSLVKGTDASNADIGLIKDVIGILRFVSKDVLAARPLLPQYVKEFIPILNRQYIVLRPLGIWAAARVKFAQEEWGPARDRFYACIQVIPIEYISNPNTNDPVLIELVKNSYMCMYVCCAMMELEEKQRNKAVAYFEHAEHHGWHMRQEITKLKQEVIDMSLQLYELDDPELKLKIQIPVNKLMADGTSPLIRFNFGTLVVPSTPIKLVQVCTNTQ